MAKSNPEKEQQLAEVQKLAAKHGIKLGKSPLVTDLLEVLQRLDKAQDRIDLLEMDARDGYINPF